MIAKYLAVKDIPSAARAACVERGHSLYAERFDVEAAARADLLAALDNS